MPEFDHCTNCRCELADVSPVDLHFDENGNVFCCDDCKRDALAALWEASAYPADVFPSYVD